MTDQVAGEARPAVNEAERQPDTRAGRDLLEKCQPEGLGWVRGFILAIEREAAAAPALDVDRLYRAIEEVTEEWDDIEAQPSVIFAGSQYDLRERIAAEYARLSEVAP